jgi:hypothetical protein
MSLSRRPAVPLGPPTRWETCGKLRRGPDLWDFCGASDALLSLLTMVRNRAVADVTLGSLDEIASAPGHDLAGCHGFLRTTPE